jgi:hypothetical protein
MALARSLNFARFDLSLAFLQAKYHVGDGAGSAAIRPGDVHFFVALGVAALKME